MHDLPYERFLNNETTFAPRNGHRLIEMWNPDEPGPKGICFRERDLLEREIVDCVAALPRPGDNLRMSLRILLCPKAPAPNPTRRMPFSRDTYESLAAMWSIPSLFLRAVCQQLALVTQCTVKKQQTPPAVDDSPSSDNSDTTNRISAIIAKGEDNWTWSYSLAVMHDPSSNTTTCLCVGLSATEIALITRYILSCKDLAYHPMLLPIVIIDLAVEDTTDSIRGRLKLLETVQQATKMDRFSSMQGLVTKHDRTGLDLDDIMLRLTCLSDWASAHSSFTKSQLRFHRVIEQITTRGRDGARVGEDFDQASEAFIEFSQRLDFIKATLESAEQKLVYLKESIDGQVQTIYSLIGQKDNRLNIAAADASRQIADDSHKVALLTRKDSTDMRIIAAVTLIFLPGTFTATFFSTQFFEFSSSSANFSDMTVSPEIWLYAVTTVCLTFVVLCCWWYAAKTRNQHMSRQFNMEDLNGGDISNEQTWSSFRSLTNDTLVGGRAWCSKKCRERSHRGRRFSCIDPEADPDWLPNSRNIDEEKGPGETKRVISS